jgi:tetratricopeptide (TPR) repeat protein
MQRGMLAAVCALVFVVYVYVAHSGLPVSWGPGAADDYYNLLVQGFHAGQLSLKIDVPPGLAQLADPYDRKANAAYGLLDLSYYKGRLYLYFGVTPALVLFWPYAAVTGDYLSQTGATLVFCVVGFLMGAGLLCALWRRYFADVSVWVVATGMLALGLANGAPLLLAWCYVWEVPISCGYALTMLALAAIWKALHGADRRGCWWLTAGSLAYGLALGARPSLLFGSVILLVPMLAARRKLRDVGVALVAGIGPIMVIGLGLMAYNWLRFDRPLEFGVRYQLAGDRELTRQFFSLRFLWFNFRAYFLGMAQWSGRFPFVHGVNLPTPPAGHGRVEHPFGILTNIPVVWLALAAPLALRGRSGNARPLLGGFLTVVAVMFGIVTLTLGSFYYVAGRYQVEFLPALVLLAVAGILSLERILAGQPLRRCGARVFWGLLLAFSVAFSVLASVGRCAQGHYYLGMSLQRVGRVQEAIGQYEQAVLINPNYAEAHYNEGVALEQAGRTQEAIEHYEQALRIKPDFVEAQNALARLRTAQ